VTDDGDHFVFICTLKANTYEINCWTSYVRSHIFFRNLNLLAGFRILVPLSFSYSDWWFYASIAAILFVSHVVCQPFCFHLYTKFIQTLYAHFFPWILILDQCKTLVVTLWVFQLLADNCWLGHLRWQEGHLQVIYLARVFCCLPCIYH
jgi:hypothetical protein